MTVFSSAFIFCLVWMSAYSAWFRKRQNARNPETGLPVRVGGDISIPKSLWLAYTLGAWFLFSPVAAVHLYLVSSPWFLPFLVLALSWWIRGILELFMIYRWFNWSPVYGISHDLFHIVAMLTMTALTLSKNPDLPLLSWPFIYLIGHVISVGFETLFAWMFLKTRGPDADLIYFASDEPKYRCINRVTWLGVAIAYAHFTLSILMSV
jgi:hypothetical protein